MEKRKNSLEIISLGLIVLLTLSLTSCGSGGSSSGGGGTTGSSSSGNLEGRVYTGNWNGISGARVCLVAISCTTTDGRGWYSFNDITEGVYVITASASGFSYYSGSVRIRPGIANQHHIQLDPN
jgi:hypothetical protein